MAVAGSCGVILDDVITAIILPKRNQKTSSLTALNAIYIPGVES